MYTAPVAGGWAVGEAPILSYSDPLDSSDWSITISQMHPNVRLDMAPQGYQNEMCS
jgi:hypothetical protein